MFRHRFAAAAGGKVDEPPALDADVFAAGIQRVFGLVVRRGAHRNIGAALEIQHAVRGKAYHVCFVTALAEIVDGVLLPEIGIGKREHAGSTFFIS